MNYETGISTAIHNLLLLYENMGKCYVVRHNSVAGKLERGGYIKQAKKGVPDFIVCIKGLWVGLEVKTEVGRQSPEQKVAQKLIELTGGRYYIVRNVDTVKHIVDELLNDPRTGLSTSA